MRVKFTVGDWSKDGHNESDTYVVDIYKLGQFTEPTKAEIDQAFHDGCILMGLSKEQCKSLDFIFCQEYGDNKIPQEVIDGMKRVGLNPDNYFDGYRQNESSGCHDTFHLLWLDIMKVGSNSNLYYQECKGEVVYHIGGYGLYSN